MSYPFISVLYPLTVFSVTVYSISFPPSYFGRSVKLYSQLVSAVALASFTFFPFARRFTVISFGRFPSWLSPSFQVFFPLISVVSGVWLFSILIFPISLLSISVVYPSTSVTSFTSYFMSFPFAFLGSFVHV